jgi:hypothetical protein
MNAFCNAPKYHFGNLEKKYFEVKNSYVLKQVVK